MRLTPASFSLIVVTFLFGLGFGSQMSQAHAQDPTTCPPCPACPAAVPAPPAAQQAIDDARKALEKLDAAQRAPLGSKE